MNAPASNRTSIWIGYDPREAEAYGVARHSFRRNSVGVPIYGLCLHDLREMGLYTRPTSRRVVTKAGPDGKTETSSSVLWDDISGAPMATEFAISRFLVPLLARRGLALFVDCDVLALADVSELFRNYDYSKAVMCVQHDYKPAETTKMDGQVQTAYTRKNWSSVMVFNCDHPANRRLTLDMVNALPGRELHQFCWLEDDEIGALDPGWNHLVNVSPIPVSSPLKIAHYTLGGPWFGEDCGTLGRLWLNERADWVNQVGMINGRPTSGGLPPHLDLALEMGLVDRPANGLLPQDASQDEFPFTEAAMTCSTGRAPTRSELMQNLETAATILAAAKGPADRLTREEAQAEQAAVRAAFVAEAEIRHREKMAEAEFRHREKNPPPYNAADVAKIDLLETVPTILGSGWDMPSDVRGGA